MFITMLKETSTTFIKIQQETDGFHLQQDAERSKGDFRL